MLARFYMDWAANADAAARAEATGTLAEAWLYANLSPDDLAETEAALTVALDDPSPLVRRALAEVFAAHPLAPRAIVSALAADDSEVGALVLARSPLLSDAELVDCAALGDALAQVAIATRPRLSAPVAAAVAEIACAEALVTLARNVSADLPQFSVARMLDRHGDNHILRLALTTRGGISIEARHRIGQLEAERLAGPLDAREIANPARIDRRMQEARDEATVAVAFSASDAELPRFVSHLRAVHRLTPAVLLRALLCGDQRFVVAALADLADLKPARVAAMAFGGGGPAFPALYARAKLPPILEEAFRAAVHAARGETREAAPRLRRRVVLAALGVCGEGAHPDLMRLRGLLFRFEVEAARTEARLVAAAMLATPSPIDLLELESPSRQLSIGAMAEPEHDEEREMTLDLSQENANLPKDLQEISEEGLDEDAQEEALQTPSARGFLDVMDVWKIRLWSQDGALPNPPEGGRCEENGAPDRAWGLAA